MAERLYQKRPDGVWYGWFYDRAGKRRQRCLKVFDKRAAREALRRLERAAHGADSAAADRPPTELVGELLSDFLLLGLPGRSPATVVAYTSQAGHVVRLLGSIEAGVLSRDDVVRYAKVRTEEGAHSLSVGKELSVLRCALRWGWESKRLPSDPQGVVPTWKATYIPRTRRLTIEEARRFIGTFKPHRQRWLWLALLTGGRKSEVNRLAWADVDLRAGFLTLPGTKTARARRPIPINDDLRRMLESWPRELATVVEPWSRPRNCFGRHADQLGIPRLTPNDLRRSFASWLVQVGTPLKVVAQLLGHTTTTMVDRVYGHLETSQLQAAMATLPRTLVPIEGGRGRAKRKG